MLKTTLIAGAAALAFVAAGATDAHAGKGGDRHYKGGHHYDGGYHWDGKRGKRGGKHRGRHHRHGWHRPPSWFDYSWYPKGSWYAKGPRCYAPRKVRIKVWDRRGRPYHKWVWRDVRVC